MAISGPTKLSTILIQRLDTMLGAKIGQQSLISSGTSPQSVLQADSAKNLQALKNPAEQELIEDLSKQDKQAKQNKTITKTLPQLDLDKITGQRNTSQTITRSAPTTLGYAARMILALLNKYPESSHNIRGPKPLLSSDELHNLNKAGQAKYGADFISNNKAQPHAVNAPKQPNILANLIAKNLALSIRNSGLFYESQLGKLAQSKISINDLKDLPQAKITNNQNQENQYAYNKNLALADESNELLLNNDKHSASANQNMTTSPNETSQSHNPTNHEQLQHIVRQQLEVLANQSLIWRGEIWAGAEMECKFIRHENEDDQGAEEKTKDLHGKPETWSSNLNLELPVLGPIKAKLQLQGKQINLHIIAPDCAKQLQQASHDLFQKLLNTGLQPQQVLISHTNQQDEQHDQAS